MNAISRHSLAPGLSGASRDVSTDLCIIGTGPAGIAIAKQFIGTGLKLCLVENGSDAASPASQQLAAGETFGDPIHAPGEVCTRAFGGNSNAWHVRIEPGRLGLRLVPPDDLDFEQRDWLPFSGWPFARSHLMPHYERAQEVCRAGPFAYEPDAWETAGTRRFPIGGNMLETAMFQFGPAEVFHRQYRQELSRAPNVNILCDTTAVEIETTPQGNAATRILCARGDGKRMTVMARHFVLATGGFENARLLLLSDRQCANGIGNQRDVVGRYLHDHPIVFGGTLTPFDPGLFNTMGLYDLHQRNGFPVMGHFRLSDEVRRQNKLLNMSVSLFPRPKGGHAEAVLALQELRREFHARRKPARSLALVRQVVRRADTVATAAMLSLRSRRLICTFEKGGWSALARNEKRFETFHLLHQVEQTPDPANRVTLGQGRDRLDCRKLQVHWRWSREDADQVTRAQALMAAEFRRSGFGEFRIATKDGLPDLLRPSGSHHLMGTTRMHHDPKFGVVDADCRVHGMANLFIAGSSVMPTAGYANPTLTIVALALRLADHLKAELAGAAAGAFQDRTHADAAGCG